MILACQKIVSEVIGATQVCACAAALKFSDIFCYFFPKGKKRLDRENGEKFKRNTVALLRHISEEYQRFFDRCELVSCISLLNRQHFIHFCLDKYSFSLSIYFSTHLTYGTIQLYDIASRRIGKLMDIYIFFM